jgi:hypothetical protein
MSDRVRTALAGLVLFASALWLFDQSFVREGLLWDFAGNDAASQARLSGHNPFDQSFFKKGFLWDFPVNDAASHAWLTGHNPYSTPEISNWWSHCRISLPVETDISGLPPVSPPPGLVMFAPIALLPPTISVWVWMVLCVALLALEFIALLRLARLPAFSAAGMLMMACVLLMSPLRICFVAGQAAAPVASLIVLAVWAASEDRPRTAGILLAAAAALKLQVALPFMLIYLFIGRPRITLWGLAITLSILAIALIGLHVGGTHWFASWRSTLESVSRRGGLNDFDITNVYNYELLNLQLPLGAMIASRMLVNTLSVLIAAVLTMIFLALLISRQHSAQTGIRRSGRSRDDLLIAATLAPLLLLPVYHRYYDGVVLALTIAWTFREVTRKRIAIPCTVGLLLLLSMFAPHSVVPRLSERLHDKHLDSVVQSVWYNALVVPHRVWLLVLMTWTMLYALRRDAASVSRQTTGTG